MAIHNFIHVMDLRDRVLSDSTDPFYDRVSTTIASEQTVADDRVFRHCAVISNLYAVYEDFVEQSLSLWSTRLPKYRRFQQLSPGVQRSYREGVAALLNAINRKEYQDVDLSSVLRNYADSLDNVSDWIMISDALLFRESNLRRREIVKLYRFAELPNIWDIVETDREVKECLQIVGEGASLEATVEEFVQFRNEAAHGNPDEILGIDRLLAWADFIEAFCEGLMKPLAAKNIDEERSLGTCTAVGTVYKVFSGRVFLAQCNDCELRVGQRLYARKNTRAYSFIIESIHVNDESVTCIPIDSNGANVGVKGSRVVHDGAELFFDSSLE